MIIATLLGCIAGMALLSRIVLLLLRPWKNGGVPRLAFAHGMSFCLSVVLVTLASQRESTLPLMYFGYGLGAVLWFFYDFIRIEKRSDQEDEATRASQR